MLLLLLSLFIATTPSAENPATAPASAPAQASPLEQRAALKERYDVEVEVGAHYVFNRRRIAETNSVFGNGTGFVAERDLIWGTTSFSPGIGANVAFGDARLTLNWDWGKVVGIGEADMGAFTTELTVPFVAIGDSLWLGARGEIDRQRLSAEVPGFGDSVRDASYGITSYNLGLVLLMDERRGEKQVTHGRFNSYAGGVLLGDYRQETSSTATFIAPGSQQTVRVNDYIDLDAPWPLVFLEGTTGWASESTTWGFSFFSWVTIGAPVESSVGTSKRLGNTFRNFSARVFVDARLSERWFLKTFAHFQGMDSAAIPDAAPDGQGLSFRDLRAIVFATLNAQL